MGMAQFANIAFDVCQNFGSFQSGFAPWQVNTFLALLVTTLFIAIIYMFSHFYRNPQMSAWAKFELFQVIVTAVIAIGAVAFIGATCSFSPGVFGLTPDAAARYSGQTMYSAAQNYLEWLRTTTLLSFTVSFAVNSMLGRAQGITWNMRPTGVGFSTQPFAGVTPISGSVNILINGITLAFMITVAQKAILNYISIAMLNYLLPLGIFFRAFAPTRQFGGAMIGMAIGMFIFYPMMLVFNDFAVRSAMDQLTSTATNQMLSNFNSGFPTDKAGAEAARSDSTSNILSDATPDAGGNIPSAENSSIMVFYVIRIAFNVFVASVVLVAINFAVLITVVRELSRIFGEEVDVSSLTRMI
ncbi:MAG: hypothetical protein WC506_06020 [Candidatus Micrarchaeia archaeon]